MSKEAMKLALEAWAETAMRLAADLSIESLRLGSYERKDTYENAGRASWQTIEIREKREAARERLRQHVYTSTQAQLAQQQEQKLEFVSPGGGYVPAIPRPIPLDWKLVPRKATPEMLRAMDECAQEGYDERLYEGMASSVYMAAWDASPVLGTLPPSEKERSMMDIIVGNLVREGINKHRARELAEHFIKHTSPPARQRHISYACPQCHWSLEEQPAQRTWVGLTDDDKCVKELYESDTDPEWIDGYTAGLKDAENKLRRHNAQPALVVE